MVFDFDSKTYNFSHRRVRWLYEKYSASGVENYSQAFATYISPLDYLSLSASTPQSFVEKANPLDFGRLDEEYQEIFLTVDMDTGEVVGHEGRHRMAALYNAGAEKVAIAIRAFGEKDRYDRKPIDQMVLQGQEFPYLEPPQKAPGVVSVNNLIPFSQACKGAMMEYYGPMHVLRSYFDKDVYQGNDFYGKIVGVGDVHIDLPTGGSVKHKHILFSQYTHHSSSLRISDFMKGVSDGVFRVSQSKSIALDHVIASAAQRASNCVSSKNKERNFIEPSF